MKKQLLKLTLITALFLPTTQAHAWSTWSRPTKIACIAGATALVGWLTYRVLQMQGWFKKKAKGARPNALLDAPAAGPSKKTNTTNSTMRINSFFSPQEIPQIISLTDQRGNSFYEIPFPAGYALKTTLQQGKMCPGQLLSPMRSTKGAVDASHANIQQQPVKCASLAQNNEIVGCIIFDNKPDKDGVMRIRYLLAKTRKGAQQLLQYALNQCANVVEAKSIKCVLRSDASSMMLELATFNFVVLPGGNSGNSVTYTKKLNNK